MKKRTSWCQLKSQAQRMMGQKKRFSFIEISKTLKSMLRCRDLLDDRRTSQSKRVPTRKETESTTSGTINTFRISKLARLGWCLSIAVVQTLTPGLRKLTGLKRRDKLRSAFTLRADAAQKAWIVVFITVYLRWRTFRQLRLITWKTFLVEAGTRLSRKTELVLAHSRKNAKFCASVASSSTILKLTTINQTVLVWELCQQTFQQKIWFA